MPRTKPLSEIETEPELSPTLRHPQASWGLSLYPHQRLTTPRYLQAASEAPGHRDPWDAEQGKGYWAEEWGVIVAHNVSLDNQSSCIQSSLSVRQTIHTGDEA